MTRSGASGAIKTLGQENAWLEIAEVVIDHPAARFAIQQKLEKTGEQAREGRWVRAHEPGFESMPLAPWQEQLEVLRTQEAILSDPEQKFQVRELIEESPAKIREHGGGV